MHTLKATYVYISTLSHTHVIGLSPKNIYVKCYLVDNCGVAALMALRQINICTYRYTSNSYHLLHWNTMDKCVLKLKHTHPISYSFTNP